MKRYCNKSYFKSIDTANKAYYLGFIYADGCLINGKTSKYKLSIGISSKDRDVLVGFLKDLNSNHSILNRQFKDSGKNDLSQIDICSKEMYNDLINLNLTERKSLDCKFPNIPREYIRDFIRGYFDGDGCVCDRSDKNKIYPAVSIVGSLDFLKHMLQELPIKRKTISTSKALHSKLGYIKFSSKKDVKAFYEYMYTDRDTFLVRKKDKFDYLLTNYGKNKITKQGGTSTTKLEPSKAIATTMI